MTAVTLSSLPPPDVVEAVGYDQILSDYKDLVGAHIAEILPNWNRDLKSDLIVTLCEALAYRELLLRQRVNDAARASLLAFAGGGDLDHVGAFYDVGRLPDESDNDFRGRIHLRISAWANAGGSAHYRYWTLTSSVDVLDARVGSPSPGHVRVAVLARPGVAPSDDLLATVLSTITRDDVRALTDTVSVVPAQIVPVDVIATVTLGRDTPVEVYTALSASLRAAVDAARGLGWSMTRAWLLGRLAVEGVHNVRLDAPAADVIVPPDGCLILGGVHLVMERAP